MILYAAGTSPELPVHLFYGGTERLVFEEPTWTWYRCNEDGTRTKLYGCTGVLKIVDKSAALINWAVKLALSRTRQLLVEGGYVGEDARKLYEDTLDAILAKSRKADSEALTDAGDVGHAAHKFLEDVVRATIHGNIDRQLELLAKFPEDERAENCAIAGLEFFHRHNVRFICAERPVYSKELQCCGTMDLLCLTDSCDDPKCCPVPHKDSLTLGDYKSSNQLYGTYLAQSAIYQKAYQEETGQHIERRFILRLGKTEAEFESWHMAGDTFFQEDLDFYKNALALYKSVHLIDDRISDIRASHTALRREEEKTVRDAEYAVKCLDADDYKGVRRKKGCNGTETVCQACAKLYLDKHPVV